MATENELQQIAERAKNLRRREQDTLIGFCFENAEEMSHQLRLHDIEHKLEYVGIINDVVQYTDASVEDCVKAAETGVYPESVPSTVAELPDEANHYVISLEINGDKWIVEPCSEVRDEHFRDVFVGRWPTKSYLPLKDGEFSPSDKFSY